MPLTAITRRLEEYDYASTSLDLRGKSRQSNDNQSSPSVPRLKVRRFVTALKQFHIPPCIIKPSQRSNLTYLAIHNNLLDKCELPLLWDVCCRYMPQLEALCCRNHDVGDDGLDLLIKALMTNKARGEMGLKELYLSHCNKAAKDLLPSPRHWKIAVVNSKTCRYSAWDPTALKKMEQGL